MVPEFNYERRGGETEIPAYFPFLGSHTRLHHFSNSLYRQERERARERERERKRKEREKSMLDADPNP